jgi:hypothetical protein
MGVIGYKCRLGIKCIVHDIGWLQETLAEMISCRYVIGDAAYHFVGLAGYLCYIFFSSLGIG